MFKCGDHMMGIQGHPEYTIDILLHLIDRLLQRNFIAVCPFARLYSTPMIFEFLCETWFGLFLLNARIDKICSLSLSLQETYASELKANLGAREPDREALKKLCISFLKGRLWRQTLIKKKWREEMG